MTMFQHAQVYIHARASHGGYLERHESHCPLSLKHTLIKQCCCNIFTAGLQRSQLSFGKPIKSPFYLYTIYQYELLTYKWSLM